MAFVKVGGYFVAMKGPSYKEELTKSAKAIKILGGELKEVKEIEIDDNYRALIVIKKVKPTPDKYPRGGGKPRKNPL